MLCDYRTLLVPVEEEDAEGKRSITWQVIAERCLDVREAYYFALLYTSLTSVGISSRLHEITRATSSRITHEASFACHANLPES